MMLLSVKKAEYVSDYKIKLFFNNGKSKTVDLKDTVFKDHREIFKALRDIEYFKRFKIELNTIAWENGLDLAPEYLYKLKISDHKHLV
jgi:hypothetical protein